MSRLTQYYRISLEALPVNGPDGLRSLMRAEFAAGNIHGITGSQISALGKRECIALLLGEPLPESAPSMLPARENALAPVQRSPLAPSHNGAGAGLAAMAALFEPYLSRRAEIDGAEISAQVESVLSSRIEPMLQELKADVWASRPVEWRIVDAKGEARDIGRQHSHFPDLLAQVEAGNHVWLVGPAGSGKTTAAEKLAEALGLPFYFNGAIDTEYKLLGFTDALGRVVSRPFRKAWEQGGVYLFDEIDGSLPPATLAFNAALANGICDFPDGCIPKHKNFRCVAAGNTWGGATAEYVGRFKPDAAFLDRFVQVEWPYDETLELEIALSQAVSLAEANAGAPGVLSPDAAKRAASEWTGYVQSLRAGAKRTGVKVVISPRASFHGARLLTLGKLSREKIIASTLRKGMDETAWTKLQ